MIMLLHTMKFEIEQLLSPLILLLGQFLKVTVENLRKLRMLVSKLSTVTEILPYAISTDKDDLFCYPRNHAKWQKIYPFVTFRVYDNKINFRSWVLHMSSVNPMIRSYKPFSWLMQPSPRARSTKVTSCDRRCRDSVLSTTCSIARRRSNVEAPLQLMPHRKRPLQSGTWVSRGCSSSSCH